MKLNTFSPIREIIHWERSGGEARAGLPTQSFDKLVSTAINLRSQLHFLGNNLDAAVGAWGAISSRDNFHSHLSTLVSSLASAQPACNEALEVSGLAYSQATDLYSMVQSYISQDAQSIMTLQMRQAHAQVEHATAQALLAAARSQLRGERGFLNGFITGITLTIANPVQDNIDRAEAAASSANAAVHKLKQSHQKITVHRREKTNGSVVLRKLLGVQKGTNSLRNTVQKTHTKVTSALQLLSPAERQNNEKVAKILSNMAQPAMNDLIKWNQAIHSI